MAMPPCGTFRYTGIVPEDWSTSSRLTLCDPSAELAVTHGRSILDNRLVGLDPTLETSKSQWTIKASGPHRAQVSSATLELSAELSNVFRVGDRINLRRTATADIGISLVRGAQLIFAIGAVTQIPLGRDITATGGPPVDGSPRDWPRLFTWVDVAVSGETVRLRRDEHVAIRDYSISIIRSFLDGMPGTYECLAIALQVACPPEPALQSAKLIARRNAGLVMGDEVHQP